MAFNDMGFSLTQGPLPDLVERRRQGQAQDFNLGPVGKAVDDPTRTEAFPEGWILGVVRVFGLFLGVEVIEVSVELVEAVVGGKKLVFVS